MRRLSGVSLLALGVIGGAGGGYWYARHPASASLPGIAPSNAASAVDRKILYYRDPSGAPSWSATPKQDANGRDYLPVYDDEEPAFGPGGELKRPALPKGSSRKALYYRNPMGLPGTSPVPKKDWMGMDYIPVYEGEEPQDGSSTVKISPEKIQRSGVRTEVVETRPIIELVRAVGTVTHDESRLTVVTMRSDAYIEDLFVNKTGEHVHAGDPLFRAYSPDIVSAQVDLRNGGSEQRLRNLGVPESHIREVRAGKTPMSLVWPAPASGDVIVKNVVNGQKVKAGDELYRIADHSHVWIIADVAESDLPAIKIGTRAAVTVRAYMAQPVQGQVTLIYPELKAETRTARVRIEVPNPDDRLKIDMYADVVFQTGEPGPVIAVPASAVIDSGQGQVALVAKGEGRFEPRPIKVGRRGGGYVEVLEGLSKGEEVVTSATFLIDAESNLKAALQAFAQPEGTK
ncbi:MAG TPA: efflux RND transporter periplasmic adaptor subunit [Xanthobacteraceae bacterium]|jgi:Cu(I)/Ag(I) efflux system membrane fusion protein